MMMINGNERELLSQEDIKEEETDEREPEDVSKLKEVTERITEVQKQSENLELRLKDMASVTLNFRIDWWDSKRWNDYLYNTREPDFFQLPVLNQYLSEWSEDKSYDEESIFKECRKCLKIIDDLKFAIVICLNRNEKELNLWKEGIYSIMETISRKLDYMSFMIFKDASKYLDAKSENMEYGIVEGEEEDCIVTLCLWVNIYRTVRQQKASILDFSFRFPQDVVVEDCAVRLMHTTFDHVCPEKFPIEEGEMDETEAVEEVTRNREIELTKKTVSFDTDKILNIPEDNVEELEVGEETEKRLDEEEITAEDGDRENSQEENRTSNQLQAEEDVTKDTIDSKSLEEVIEVKSQEKNSKERLASFDPKRLPPLVEPEIQVVDPDEYFTVGGIFHFELFVMPLLTERKGAITYIHRELEKLRRIRYKRKIVPPRTLDGDTSYTLTVYEKVRFQKEVSNAIYVQLKLPKKVLFLGNPEPARLFIEKGGYSTDCIYEAKFYKDTRKISFKTNQFGIFGMLQKKYENFPYKEWSLTAGNPVFLILKGKRLDIKIQISSEGYSITNLSPCDDFIFSEVNSTWMFADLLVEKLRSVGINIVHGRSVDKFVNVSKKIPSIENKVYDCIALLSGICGFKPANNSPPRKDEIHLESTIGKEEKVRNVAIQKDGARLIFGSSENLEVLKTVKEESEYPTMEEGIPDENKVEKDSAENPKIEKEAEQDSAEKEREIQSGEIDRGPKLHSDLYSLLMAEMDEIQKESVANTDARLLENVRSLLRICRPISSI